MADNFLDELESELAAQAPRDALAEIEATLAAPAVQQESKPWWKRAASELVDPEAWKHSLGIVARGALQGIQAPVTIPADFGLAVRSKITGEPFVSLSSILEEERDAWGLPRAQTGIEKVNEFVAGSLAGSKIPVPQAKNLAPPGFVPPPASLQQEVFQQGAKEGLVAPPTTVNPSAINKATEGLAGKLTTAQQASMRNQPVFNRLAKRALGMADDADITPAALENIRKEAGKVYEQIANTGDIVPDQQYLNDLARLGQSADEIAKEFPGANVGATKQIGEVVDSLLQNKFSAKGALQYLRELRKQASGNLSGINATDPAKQSLGMAQREAAATLEDLIGRHLETQGLDDLANSFAGARRQIAMTYSVEDALNESTGNVVAAKLAKQLGKGKPLSGDLETIAKFAQAFPKASREVVESMPGISPLDYAAAFGSAVVAQNPSPLAWLTLRPAARTALLSDAWQRQLINTPLKPREELGLAPAAAIQAIAGED